MPLERWRGTREDVADLAGQFDNVAAAANASAADLHGRAAGEHHTPLPVYLGEFGVNVDFGRVVDDAVAWVRAVQQLTEARGFGWAVWTYYLSPKGLTTASNAPERLAQWDCSAVRAAALEVASTAMEKFAAPKIGLFLEASRDEDEVVRAAAVYAIERCVGLDWKFKKHNFVGLATKRADHDACKARLLEMRTDESEDVRIDVADALEMLGYEEEAQRDTPAKRTRRASAEE